MSAKKHIIAIANQKGGVGKTTTTINLASYLAKQGRRVLIVDLDPQANSTSGLGLDKQAVQVGAYDCLFDASQVAAALQETSYGFWLLPTSPQLAAAEVDLVGELSREARLRTALKRVEFDIVLIDCPPSLGLLTINALTAASYLLIPVQAEYYALEGLSQLLETTGRVRQALNPGLDLLGVLLTMHDNRTSLSDEVLAQVQQHFPSKVFTTIIPRNVRLAEAPSHGRPIAEHDRWSKGAKAYKKLAKELDKRLASQL